MYNNSGRASKVIGGWYKEQGKAPLLPLIVTAWDEGWGEADRATMRANNINNLLTRPEKAGGYSLTPADKTPAFIKGSRFPK
jgi:hypothetical protein